MKPTQSQPHSLETLAFRSIGCLLTCILMSSALHGEELATVKLEQAGASISKVSKQSSQLEIEFHLTGRDLTDEQLAPIADLAEVAFLNLRDTRITDEGLKHLRMLRKLRSLHLERTAVTDKGIAQLAELANLEYLNLYGTKVGDRGLRHLAKLKKLRSLYLWQTEVTDDGVAQLRKALPVVKVVRGLDFSDLPEFALVKPEPIKPTGELKFVRTSSRDAAPKSENGENTTVIFENKSAQPVRLYWIDYGNGLKLYGTLKPNELREQNTYENNSWLVTDEKDGPLGYFVATAEVTKAVIPKAQ